MKRIDLIATIGICLLSANGTAFGQETNNEPALDYKSFQIIARRNMFDPARRGNQPSAPVSRAPRVESFTLVGTMSFAQNEYAFFDSASAQYRKTLKRADTIAGYKIVQISADYIKLAASSNRTINLPMGARMKRQEGGAWTMTADQETEPVPPTSAADPLAGSAMAPASPSANDALQRLMLKRLQEK